MNFEVLIDSPFAAVTTDRSLAPIGKKHVLSCINDFEGGTWRQNRFIEFIFDNIAETSLSYRERKALADRDFSRLRSAAKNLRLGVSGDPNEGSELAEICLYGIMKHHYDALPVVPKIFYKQNSKDYAKGADSVHLVIDSEGTFSIWMGESKFFDSIEDARLTKVVTSVGNSLKPEKLRKENSIITSLSELNDLDIDEQVREEIRDLLSQDKSLDELKPRLHIPILLLHQCDITAGCSSMSDKYRQQIIEYHRDRCTAYFKKQLSHLRNEHLYDQITFHVILFPVPLKARIIDAFIDHATSLRGAANDGI